MPRDRQRGNSLLLALIVMSALATLGSLTVVSVQSSLKASTNDRSESVASYAAESGAAAAMIYLRQVWLAAWNGSGTGSFAVAFSTNPPPVFGNNALPGAGSPLSADQNAYYSVAILPVLATEPHADRRAIIRSTGYGPQGTTSIVEWQVEWDQQYDVTHPTTAPHPDHALILLGWHTINL